MNKRHMRQKHKRLKRRLKAEFAETLIAAGDVFDLDIDAIFRRTEASEPAESKAKWPHRAGRGSHATNELIHDGRFPGI